MPNPSLYDLNRLYYNQIARAQAFLEENSHADLSRVKCLLRMMMPKEVHDEIEKLHECRDPHITYNILGGNNLLAPQAKTIKQHIYHIPLDSMDLQRQPFSSIDLSDPFFDSLRSSYEGFDNWFRKKAAQNEMATVYYDNGSLKDFLYLKIEDTAMTDVEPSLPACRRLKVGTFKIENRGTRRGERLMKKLLDIAVEEDVDETYVTIFPESRLQCLIKSFQCFGFQLKSFKHHSDGRIENVYVRDMRSHSSDILAHYPFIKMDSDRYFMLSIKPEYHTRLFPDSILKNEQKYDVIQDLSETNSIYKIYICWMRDVAQLQRGDKVIIYRTNDHKGPANYRSVCTSVCTILEIRKKADFASEEEYLRYAKKYSVFSESDLLDWYRNRPGFIIIKMAYNIAFTRKVILKELREEVGLEPDYWGFFQLTAEQFDHILRLGAINERYLIR